MNDLSIKNVTFVKTVLMVIIVFFHSMLFMKGTWFDAIPIQPEPIPMFICTWMNSFHVMTFVFVSGYLFHYLKVEQGKYQKFGPFLLNKIKRLLIPYLFVLFVWVIPIRIAFYGFNFQKILTDCILGVSPDQLWFILALFIAFIIFYPLTKLFTKKWSFIIALLFPAISSAGSMYLPDYFQIWSAFRVAFFFYLGFAFRHSWEKKLSKVPCFVWVLLNIALYVGRYLMPNDQVVWNAISGLAYYLVTASGCFMAWFILQKIATNTQWDKSKTFSYLTKSSMIVYLVHQQLVYVPIYFLYGKVGNYGLVIINFIFAFGVSLLIAAIVLRFNVLRFLFGEKKKKTIPKVT